MDFRSQLSAFQSGGGGGRGNGRDSGRGNNQGGYNSQQSNGNRSRGYNDSGRDGGGGGGNYYGRGGGGRGGGDRRRGRDWNSPQERGIGGGAGGPPPQSKRRVQSPDRDGLDSLRYHGYKIPRGLPPVPTPEQRQRKTKHLALLVISINDLPYEEIWKAWCQTVQATSADSKDDYYISLVCHAKYPKQVQSQWLRQRILVYPPKAGRGNSYMDPEFLTRAPNWGSIEITRAMLDLLQAALEIGKDKELDMRFSADRFLVRRPPLSLDADYDEPIPPVDQFLYVSETCLPVATAQEFFEVLKDTTVSWVNARHRKDEGTPRNAYENDQFGNINRRIPGQYRWKADQWTVLCRDHASQIIGLDRPHIPIKYQLWQSYSEISASDEMYIPTSLALLGLLRFTADGGDTQRHRANSLSADGNNNKATTTPLATATKPSASGGERAAPPPSSAPPSSDYEFVKKRPITYTDWSQGMRNPATFTKGVTDFQRVAQLAREAGCLVARKFAPYLSIPRMSKQEQEQNATGHISAEEWKQVVEKLFLEQKSKEPLPKEPLADTTERPPEPAVDQAIEKEAESPTEDSADENEESFITSGGAKNKSDDEEEEEEDEDDGENQLE